MANEVIKHSEVMLNGVRYPILGKIQPELRSAFAQKMVTGDYTLDSDPDVSVFGQNDFRGGVLVEEMIESQHGNRSWFSTCNTDYRGHLTAQRLATQIAAITLPTPTIVNGDMELAATGWTGGARDNTYAHDSSTYSWLVTDSSGGTSTTATQAIVNGWAAGAEYTFTCYVYYHAVAETGTVTIGINDGVTPTYSSSVAQSDSWQEITVTKTLSASATTLQLILSVLYTGGANPISCWFDDASVVPTSATTPFGTFVAYENFNSNCYIASGRLLSKLNTTTGATVDLVFTAPSTSAITCLKSSLNSKLYIGQGDTDNYLHMAATTEVYTTSDSSGMTFVEQHDGKLFKMNATGTCYYSTDPDGGSPTWTTAGNITDLVSGDLGRLRVYFDADGNDTIYATTKKGLKALDLTNTLWYDTAIELGNHPAGGKGALKWRDGFYVSAGLNIQRYISGTPASISSVGLDQDDGLPQEYNGEIVDLIGQNNTFMYALVDSTKSGGTSTSSVMQYNGASWSNLFVGDATEDTMVSGIVTSAYGYRLVFDHNSTMWYIDIPRGISNLKKITTNYAASAFHVTPWFDANWEVGQKLALKLSIKVSGASATETVIVKYRIDHATTALATTWATLGTITTNGVTTYDFPNSSAPAGSAFYAVQFRLDLARTTTTTLSPDVGYFALSYKRIVPARWGYRYQADCTKPYDGYSAEQLLDNMITATELGTLVPFIYEDSTHYVEVKEVVGDRLTGEGTEGTYNVFVQELV